jgi:hypothetical protein
MEYPFSITMSDSEELFRGRQNVHDISGGYWYALDTKEYVPSTTSGGNEKVINYKPLELWKSQKEMDDAFKHAYKHIEKSYSNISFQLNGAMMAEATKHSKKT